MNFHRRLRKLYIRHETGSALTLGAILSIMSLYILLPNILLMTSAVVVQSEENVVVDQRNDVVEEQFRVGRRLQVDYNMTPPKVYMFLNQLPTLGRPPKAITKLTDGHSILNSKKLPVQIGQSAPINKEKEKKKLKEERKWFTMKKVINPHPYSYIINPQDECKDSNIFIVGYVHSAPNKATKRNTVRKTWADSANHGSVKLKVFFFVGLAPNRKTQAMLDKESKKYGDIVQENFVDHYKNLTIKGSGAMRWVSTYCKQAKYVIKADDDAFINIMSLIKHLRELALANKTRDLLMCHVNEGSPVLRKGKWKVEETQYNETNFPRYCSGVAFVVTMDVARRIWIASLYTPLMWVDDAWITGMVVRVAGITHTRMNPHYSMINMDIQRKISNPDWYKFLIGHLGPKAFMPYWETLIKQWKTQKFPIPNHLEEVKPGVIY